ncbi:hypothetical protein BwSH20_29730 [Bradyrhizobium ottawaense]|nr:hypothetical protein BwSH12_77930 [Bradyrhizobium ottawaense]GMO78826.1 hypothetical protein BwSG10_48490 [Bradyrhizobium ottawaense]GMP00692.1 hypothetical protein BwSH20_29730 [Bradyrhizobium ottawaense]GMP05438.1 hypothetical protein BwDG23_48490 [Bradyrhizobium ottawaense]
MTDPLDQKALEIRLARCLELAKQFPTGPTAELLQDLEDELRSQLRTLAAKVT